MNVSEALAHNYMFEFHNPLYEPTCDKDISITLSDNIKAGVKDY